MSVPEEVARHLRGEVEAFRDEMAAHAASPRERGWIADHSIRNRLNAILASTDDFEATLERVRAGS